MANTTQDELYRTFLAVSGQQASATGDTHAMLADVIAQLQEVRSIVLAPAPASKAQTTTQAASTGGGITAGSVLSTVFKSGLGLVPLISGLVGLFSGGDATTPPPLVKYAPPAAIDFQAAETGGRVNGLEYDQMGLPRSYAGAAQSVDADVPIRDRVNGLEYDQMGMPRSYAEAAQSVGANVPINERVTSLEYAPIGIPRSYADAALSGGASVNVNGRVSGPDYYEIGTPQSYPEAAANGNARSNGSGASPQITVNVQAMDARSFLDRSNDIALAVRDAMLNLNAINDVVNEL